MDDNISNNLPSPSPDVTELNTRRTLIKTLYQEVLGKDADINGLSYYTVHKEISEDEIRKQMTQSTDHRDLVIKATKYAELEKKSIELEDQVLKLQNANAEKDVLISNLRAVTSSMQTAKPETNKTSSYAYDMMQTPASYQYNSSNPYVAPVAETPIKVTEMKFPKSKGCLGFLKSFLGI